MVYTRKNTYTHTRFVSIPVHHPHKKKDHAIIISILKFLFAPLKWMLCSFKDICWTNEILLHNWQVAEITRILRSGGVFVGTTFLRYNSSTPWILRSLRQVILIQCVFSLINHRYKSYLGGCISVFWDVFHLLDELALLFDQLIKSCNGEIYWTYREELVVYCLINVKKSWAKLFYLYNWNPILLLKLYSHAWAVDS